MRTSFSEAILDNSTTTVINSALDNWELYANKAARSGIAPSSGRKLTRYQAFGHDSPRPDLSGRDARCEDSARELFNLVTAIPTGMSERILIKSGLPKYTYW